MDKAIDISKILTIVCACILLVCLVLSITSLTVLRNAVSENAALKKSTDALVDDLRACVAEIHTDEQESEQSPAEKEPAATTDTAPEAFCVKEANGKIGVFTADGYLVRWLEVSIDDLPPADRELLRVGIVVGSWRELITLIQDYTT